MKSKLLMEREREREKVTRGVNMTKNGKHDKNFDGERVTRGVNMTKNGKHDKSFDGEREREREGDARCQHDKNQQFDVDTLAIKSSMMEKDLIFVFLTSIFMTF